MNCHLHGKHYGGIGYDLAGYQTYGGKLLPLNDFGWKVSGDNLEIDWEDAQNILMRRTE